MQKPILSYHFYFCRVLFFGILFSIGFQSFAQEIDWENTNFRKKRLVVSDSIQLDSLVVIPEKFQIIKNGIPVPQSSYRIDYETSKLYFNDSLIGDSIVIQYYTYPNSRLIEFSKDTAIIVAIQEQPNLYTIETKKKKKSNIFEGLNSRGALIRGVSFGNNQGSAVQSSLDLQLTGKLSEDVYINASISDNNVPVESDGFTQQLNEFDQLFVEIYNKNSRVRAGNLDITQSNDFFGNFSEKVTGLQVGTQINGENFTTNISAAGSVSRGEFVQARFNGQEGNQGPYRLNGNNNELFVIILSDSERVYVDGILMKRGEDQDYTINYNTGEIIFTSNRLMTANSRILVEYLYADRNYSRFLFYGGVETKTDRFRVAGHFYSNGDSKGNPINQNLTDENLEVLANAGDDPNQMIAPTAEEATFDADRIQYRQITINGVQVFEFTNDPNETVFNVNFSFVGANNGNYIQTDIDTNGRIFTYVEPISGIPQGDYEPVQQLVAPERLQLYTLNSSYQFKKDGVVGLDFAMSNRDLNLFSSVDNEDNVGIAGRVYTNKTFKTKNWTLSPRLEYSFIQDHFNPIQRIRYEEFARDFNLASEVDTVSQNYLQVGLNSQFKENVRFSYHLDFLDNEGVYRGFRNRLVTNYRTEKNLVEANASVLTTDSELQQSNFNELFVRAQRKIAKKAWVGAQWESEDNQIKELQTNTFTDASFRWNQLNLRAGIGDSAKVFTTIDLYTRKDDSARLGEIQNLSRANGIILNSKLLNKLNHRLDLNGHFRSVKYDFEDRADEDFVTGNIRWYKSFFKNGLTLNAFYELESGREPQREFQYVEVESGLGIYKYTDYNGDGIQQLDEFEIAEFNDEANYIRVFTNTVNFLSTNKNQLTFSTNIKPKQIFGDKSKFLERWLMQFSLQAGNSVLKENQTLEWNPFINEDDLLAKNRNYRLNLFFNKGNQYKWGASYNYTDQENRTFIFTGSELRESQSHLLQLKYKPLEDLFIFLDAEQSLTNSDSDVFEARRFEIDSYGLIPKLTYKLGDTFNASLNYQYQNKENTMGEEQLNQSELRTELQWNSKSKRSLFASFSYVNNQFTGNENTVVGNQMMEGLRAGNNFVWQFLYQQQITSYLNINVSYNGRRTEANSTIHSGNVQMQIRF